MKTFPNWRLAGRAMRWARQQDGVTIRRTSMDGHRFADGTTSRHVDHTWKRGEQGVLVSHSSFLTTCDVLAGAGDGTDVQMTYVDSTATVLRVLVALDLIPAEVAEADDV